MPAILIVDDEKSIRNTLREILEFEGYQVELAVDGLDALEKLKASNFDIVLCDVKMPKMDGIELLEQAKNLRLDAQFIMISGHLTIETAVEATRKGAFDFIEKPPDLNRLLITVRNALDKSKLVHETKQLKKKVPKIREIVGESESIKQIRETIAKVAPTEARVLITGSNGTGKELVARWIHELSPRASGPFVEVNCAAIPSELIESELFGHEKGAFTNAYKQRIGKFEQADNGTLFLDEIGDMSLSAQAKVLRALQENKITRVGGDKLIPVNVRVIAATNKDLRKEIEQNNFREDLYHRLSVIVIHVPSLQERITDIPILAKHLLAEICQEHNMPPKTITAGALNALMRLNWTGNVRELRNVIERLIIFCDKEITEADVLQYAAPYSTPKPSTLYDQFTTLQEFRNYMEREFILHKLIKNNWNISKTAEELDIQRTHLYNKIEKYGFQRIDTN
ncbi:MAG: sigma-54 dependent transcriptional regulator [Bacteroidia bacterium]|nr:sigma-54 dependent transcriptional regulator [Bacteroidia bacterium]MDW8157948.1 sigma-54 dependent transcriptional regulator [Bacteroidia bacterium]